MNVIPEHILNRKGARRISDLDSEVLDFLNKGFVETRNLTEWLAVDQMKVLKTVLADLGKSDWFSNFEEAINHQKKPTANSNVKLIGQTFGLLGANEDTFQTLRSHPSDVVRCWGCWAESMQIDAVSDLLTTLKPYAADTHFGVREVVIFASKERLIEDLKNAISILSTWIQEEDENLRRFAVEVVRPVGVWTKKIAALQETPELGLPLLEPLKSDASKYVRDSVANWLNDASKSQPDWVQSICDRWKRESDSKETAYILKRALRTILKK